jgi:hypothetical protein
MYEVLKRGRLHNLSVKCQLELIDSMGKPIILYGCEKLGDLEIAKLLKNTNPTKNVCWQSSLVKKIITFVLSIFTLSFHLMQIS